MPADQELTSFIRSTFASVWSLELALLLRREADTVWSHERLVSVLRASDLVVSQGVAALHAVGLLVLEEEGVQYRPVSDQLDQLVARTEALYLTSPDQVRRIIVAQRSSQLTSFANAFRLGES